MFIRIHARPTLCSFRRHLDQQDLPTKLFASPNRGGVPELGGHRRQVVRWQCDCCDPAAGLFLAQRRRRRLPEQSCDWRRARQRAAAVRRCAAVACPNAVQGKARRLTHPSPRAHKHADLRRHVSARVRSGAAICCGDPSGARRRTQPRTPICQARRIPAPIPAHARVCVGACRRAVASALRLVAVTNLPP
jgi:hypothetical protein